MRKNAERGARKREGKRSRNAEEGNRKNEVLSLPRSSVPSSAFVYVVDDDASVRKGLSRLIRSAGFNAEAFASAEEFLKRGPSAGGGCIVLDVQMPGLSGLDLQESMAKLSDSMPVIFITGHGNIPMSVRAMKKGAVDFLAKPFDDKDLLNAIAEALSRDKGARAKRAGTAEIRKHERTLTEREREVMAHVVTGMLNKQIAAKLGISEKTVKVHRGRVMTKMGVRSVAELVRLCADAEAK
jgi:FixJ family two-component response regulator